MIVRCATVIRAKSAPIISIGVARSGVATNLRTFQPSFPWFLRRSSSVPSVLHYEWMDPPTKTANTSSDRSSSYPHVTVVLHGLLGHSRNVKTLATRLCHQRYESGHHSDTASLVLDLTGHGQSAEQARQSGVLIHPVGVADVAHHVDATLRHALEERGMARATTQIDMVGHSLGGRVALYHAAYIHASNTQVPQLRIQRVWLLDTVPEAVDDSVRRVLAVARDTTTAATTTHKAWTKSQWIQHWQNDNDHSLSLATAQWLATQYNVSRGAFLFDMDTVESLADDIPRHDFWTQVRCVVETHGISVQLLVGGANAAWTQQSPSGGTPLDQVVAYSRESHGRFQYSILPKAGHWVHMDDLPGVLQAFASYP